MTVRELIQKLDALPAENKDLEIVVNVEGAAIYQVWPDGGFVNVAGDVATASHDQKILPDVVVLNVIRD